MNRSELVPPRLTWRGRRHKRCITYTLDGAVAAMLSGMTANQQTVFTKPFCFRRTIVPKGRTIAAHVPLLSTVAAGTGIACHAPRHVLETGQLRTACSRL